MIRNKRIPLICILLPAMALIAFWRVTQCDFISYDDPTYITENIHIRRGITIEAIRWAFTAVYASNWHPLTWMSHMLDIQLFGLKPQGHHFTNLLFHIANTLLLFFVFNRMTKAPWQSAFVAALFAVHPLHVESVAWVAERKDVLSTFFWMLTMVGYVHYVEDPRLKNYLALLLLFVLGLMAKPMLVTLPFVLLLLDYWPLRRFELKFNPILLLEKIPLFAFAALSCIVTYIAQNRGGAVVSLEQFPLDVRIENAIVSYIAYIGKTIWPNNLALFYPHPESLPLWQVVGAAVSFAAVTFVAIWKAKKVPYLAFGWFWFAGTLLPVIGIVQVGAQAMADRYTYITLIGLFIAASWGIADLAQKWRFRQPVLIASSALILACLVIAAYRQVGYWNNSIGLYEHALNVTGNNYVILNNRGVAYAQLGNIEESISDYDSALEINPRFTEAYYNRGIAYGKLGNHRQAIEDFDRFIEINPGDPEAYFNRCVARDKLGNHRQAIQDCDRAIEIAPELFEAYFNRGVAYGELGDHRQAIENFDKVIEINPEDGRAYFNRAVAYGELGNRAKAFEDLKTAAKFNSGQARDLLRSRGMTW